MRAGHDGVRVNGCAGGRRVDVVRHEVAFTASVGRGGGGGSRLSSGRRLRFVRDGSVGGDCGRRGHGGRERHVLLGVMRSDVGLSSNREATVQ